MTLDFFDCNVQVGRFGTPIPETLFTTQELMQRLNSAGIRRALAFHALAKELHPMEGNPALAAEAVSPEIAQCWVGLPHHTGDMPGPEEFVEAMKRAGARAVRLFPAFHNYSLSDWCAGEMLAEFERRRVPVFIEAGQTSWETIAGTLKSHPGLRLTVLQTSYRCDRYLYPLFENFKHLRIETGGYVTTGGIEAICARFGASRLVFGTGMPFYEPGAAVSMITYAQISDEDKQAIAGGNLEKLLSWS